MSVQNKRTTYIEEQKVKEDPFGKVTSSEKDQVVNEYFGKLGIDLGKSSKLQKVSNSKARGKWW